MCDSWSEEAPGTSVRISPFHVSCLRAAHVGRWSTIRRRDLLLSQIREQAAKIEELMKQLEEANKRASQKQIAESERANAPSPSHSASASTTDPSNFSTSELTGSEIGTPEPASDHLTKPDVLDWIAKARESIEAFGGYINMGGPAVTKDLLGEDVLGWKDSSSEGSEQGDAGGQDNVDEAKNGIHVEVQDVDAPASEPQRGRARPEGSSTAEASTSMVEGRGSASSTTQSSRRKKSRARSEKLAILPNEVAPIGMLANLSLKKSRSRRSSRSRSVSTVDDNEYGVANDDYFRAHSMCTVTLSLWLSTHTSFSQVLGQIVPSCMHSIRHHIFSAAA